VTPDLSRATNPFWDAQVPSTATGALTMESLRYAFDQCSNLPVQRPGYFILNMSTILAAAPLGQEMLDNHFAERAKGAARHIFGNLLAPVDAEAAGRYVIGGEWPYVISDEIADDYRTYWDEDDE
jgi:hypothetical protein